MDNDRLDALEARVRALESRWDAVDREEREDAERRRLLLEEARARHGIRPQGTPLVVEKAGPKSSLLQGATEILTGEGAVARLGSALLVLGVLYGVKYGIDRGWIVESVRVSLAALLGGALLGIGFRLRSSRRVLSDVLSGAGVAALYLSVFAAQALYSLIPWVFGAILMSLITAGCLVLAETRRTAFMAILAVVGGLATPFILRTEEVNLPGLVGYVSAVLLGAGWMYRQNGWRSLMLFTAAVSFPLATVILSLLQDPEPVALGDRIAVQFGLLLGLGLFLWLPIHRTRPGFAGRPVQPVNWLAPAVPRIALALLPAAAIVAVWGFEHVAWDLDHRIWGAIGLGLSTGLAFWYERLWNSGHRDAAIGIRIGSAWALAFTGLEIGWDYPGVQLLLFTLVPAALVFDGTSRGRTHPLWIAASLSVVSIFWFMVRITEADGAMFMNLDALADLLTLGVVGVAVWKVPDSRVRSALLLLALVGLLGLTSREFDNPGVTTAVWSVIAMVVLVAGYRFRSHGARLAGLGVLVLVIGKLLLVDMASTDPIVRVLIFLGVGSALVTLSYLFPTLWSGKRSEGQGTEA